MSWWWIGTSLLCVVLVPVLFMILRLISSRIRLQHYKKQGLPIYFFPALGNQAIFSKEQPDNKTKSNLEFAKRLAAESPSGAFVVNTFSEQTATLFIHNSDMVREFLLHEEHYIKAPIIDRLKNELGLFFQNGDKATRSKALFTKIFSYDGMDTLSPVICDLIKDSFEKFDSKHGVSSQEFKSINLEDLFDPIMERIANLIVFGKMTVPESHPISKLHASLKTFFGTLRTLRYCIPFVLFPKLAPKLGLVPPLRRIDKIVKHQQELIEKIIEERKQDPTPFGQSIIDRVLHHNAECDSQNDQVNKMSPMDIVGNFNLFLFAGTDTSQNTTKMAICYMAGDQKVQDIVHEINKEIYPTGSNQTTNVALESCNKLSLWTREILRLHSPVARSSLRIATQDTTLKGIHIKKGDRVSVLAAGLNFDNNVYSDPEKFDLSRFSPEKEKTYPKYQWVPFMVGRRVCLGRHLGEMMVKLLVTQFVLHYEFKQPLGHEYYKQSTVTTNINNPQVLVKRR